MKSKNSQQILVLRKVSSTEHYSKHAASQEAQKLIC